MSDRTRGTRPATPRPKPVARLTQPTVEIEAHGPGPSVTRDLASRVAEFAVVRAALKRARHRVLAVDLVEPATERKPAFIPPPTQYRATIYDYRNQRTLYVDGPIRQPERATVTEAAVQPVPSPEEFRAAAKLLLRDAELARSIAAEQLQVYRPLPPVLARAFPDGRSERILAVGLLPRQPGVRHEIVGVDLARRSVLRHGAGAPAASAAHDSLCGVSNAAQETVRSAAGTVRVRMLYGGQTMWRFHVLRPAASSGTNGSGIELRYVEYRGKRVLYRAHVPVVNINYEHPACEPHRNWQNEEGVIEAAGTEVAPGFVLCSAPPHTILDTGSDTGNFLGVAIHVQGLEVVIVSEMEAGWCRYISEWRLHVDGTIRARFGLSAVRNPCVCARRFHHVYWRFDFDIRTAVRNRAREYNDPPLIGGASWHTLQYEVRRPRDPARQRKWRVENTSTGEGYEIIPGERDGAAAAMPDWPFGRGDLWVLRYRGSRIDDGVIAVGPPAEAPMDAWLNGEGISDHDVVVWYGAHFDHDVASEARAIHGHVLGPTLKPVNW